MNLLCPHACRITHVHYAGPSQLIQKNFKFKFNCIFWPIEMLTWLGCCIKIGEHVALLSAWLFCGSVGGRGGGGILHSIVLMSLKCSILCFAYPIGSHAGMFKSQC